ncbi:hypothetical protein BsWGS_09089 [Bradybaena similaris]
MLDIARNFRPKEDILNIIKVMSSYKLNHLHLHLSDDEGWRIEVSRLLELTSLGSHRCYDPSETSCLMPQLGSGPDKSTSPGSGFLTIPDYVEILKLANQHHVTVIPEIDMPGHGRAAILSMKLRNITLSSRGQGFLGNSTVLTEENDPSEYTSPQMYSDNAINPCMESTYNFVDIIMDQFIDLHKQGQQPLKRFHFGGDEVGRGAWVNSSHCRQVLASNTLPDGSLKLYFYQRIAKLAANKNLTLAAWEDGLLQNDDTPFDLSTSPVKDVQANAWTNDWQPGTVSRTYKFAEQGYKVVLSSATHLYLDHPDEPDPEERGPCWATRFTDIQKVFFYNAENYYDNVPTQESGAPVPAEELCGPPSNRSCPPLNNTENIVGMEAALFSETVRTTENMYHQLFPRLLALADRAWHKASWESLPRGGERDKQQTEDWFSFARAVGYRELPKLDQQNVTYRIPPPGAILSHGRLLTTPLYPGLVVEYSLDAGITWQNAQPFVLLGDYAYRIWLRTRSADSRRVSRTVILDPAPKTNVTNQPVIDYIAQHLHVQYTVVDNYKKYGTDLYEASIRLSNTGDEAIPGGNWRIYFISVNVIEPTYILEGHEYVDNVAKITISHTKGYLYSVGPSAEFTSLNPGDHLEFNFKVQFWSVSRYEQMPRWYVSAPGMNARNLNSTAGEDLAFVSPFNKPEAWKRFDYDKFDPWTPDVRYDRNAAWEVTPLTSYPVIPTPISFTTSSKQMVSLLTDSWTVVYDTESTRSIGVAFIDMMNEFFPGAANISLSQTTPPQRYIHLFLGNVTQGANRSTEAYKIQIQAGSKAVNVTGVTPEGVFYGAVTLVQMALKSSPAGSLPDSQVEDWPRFSYRGMHVDTARNFIPKTTILKLLKVMSLYKLNKLHFHLSDDEGWRLEIPGLEDLTQVGGRRCHDLAERECVMSTLGSGADDHSSGSGFYTVKDYQEILELAKRLHIEVIPEFDMPGHAHAAIRSMKARQQKLMDLGNRDNSSHYVLDDADDTSYYYSVQYYTDNAVNPCIESTYRFISEVYKQVSEIHRNIQPLKVYHFGGDEVAKGAWLNSTACASLLRSGVSLKSLFTQRVANITKDVALMAWEDGLMDHDSLPWQRSLLANKDIIVQAWQNVWEWGVSSRAYNLANGGYKVVFSPVTHMYFDHPQEPSPEERGFYWGTRYTDAFKTFSFMPDDYYLNADIKRSGEPITLAEICGKNNLGCPPLNKSENILGLQGQLWSETVRSPEQLEYMIFPRLLALAERAWHKGSWEGKDTSARGAPLKSDWARFAASLGSQDLRILDKLGVGYRVPPPGAKQVGGTISTNVEFPGLQVQYKVGTSAWNVLQQTTTFTEGQEITLRTTSADQKRYSSEVKVVMGKIPAPKSQATVTGISFMSITCVVIYYCFNVI